MKKITEKKREKGYEDENEEGAEDPEGSQLRSHDVGGASVPKDSPANGQLQSGPDTPLRQLGAVSREHVSKPRADSAVGIEYGTPPYAGEPAPHEFVSSESVRGTGANQAAVERALAQAACRPGRAPLQAEPPWSENLDGSTFDDEEEILASELRHVQQDIVARRNERKRRFQEQLFWVRQQLQVEEDESLRRQHAERAQTLPQGSREPQTPLPEMAQIAHAPGPQEAQVHQIARTSGPQTAQGYQNAHTSQLRLAQGYQNAQVQGDRILAHTAVTAQDGSKEGSIGPQRRTSSRANYDHGHQDVQDRARPFGQAQVSTRLQAPARHDVELFRQTPSSPVDNGDRLMLASSTLRRRIVCFKQSATAGHRDSD